MDTIPAKLKKFCEAEGIATTGTLAMTIQKDRSTEFSSLIVDFESMEIATHYPVEFKNPYKEIRKGDFLIVYQECLDSSKLEWTGTSEYCVTVGPFCCGNITSYRPNRTSKDSVFQDFLQERGNYDDVVFEVKEQVNNGPMISVKYFNLKNGIITKVEGEFTQKIHAFKNYKCQVHNRFFGVDIYKESNSRGYNYHHMRVSAYTKYNQMFVSTFFNQVLKDESILS